MDQQIYAISWLSLYKRNHQSFESVKPLKEHMSCFLSWNSTKKNPFVLFLEPLNYRQMDKHLLTYSLPTVCLVFENMSLQVNRDKQEVNVYK